MSTPSHAHCTAHRARPGATTAVAMLMMFGLLGACGPRKSTLAATVAPCEGVPMVVVRNQTSEELEVLMLERTTWTLLGVARPGRTELNLPAPAPRSRLGVRNQKGVWVPTNSAIRASSTGLVMLDTECRM
jgi:hypothetical protein